MTSVPSLKHLLTALALFLASPLAAPAHAGHGDPGRIAGVWNAHVAIVVCGAGIPITEFEAMAMFEADGSFHDTNANNPLLKSESFGSWRHLRDRTYRFAFRFFRFDPMGMPLGSNVVRHDVTLARDGRSYTSAGSAEFYDTEGNLLMTGCSESTAERFR